MAFTSKNDINTLTSADSAIVGAGVGDDLYIIAPGTGPANGQIITISDSQGVNRLQLIGGLTIASSTVATNAIQIQLSNGARININNAHTFSFEVGGNPLLGISGAVQTFTQFVTTTLGVASVPTGQATATGALNVGIRSDGTTTYTNTAPIITGVPATASIVTVGEAAALADFTVTDADADHLTVTLSVSNGILNNLTDADLNTPGIQLTGTASAINAALTAATLTATAYGESSINISVTDGSHLPVSAVYNLFATQIISGKLIDGYISGATVFADTDGDGILDEGEVSVISDSEGNFTLPAGAVGSIVSLGGIDISTNLPMTGVFTAPAGSTIVSPLTTMLQTLVASGMHVAQAQVQLLAALGLPTTLDLRTLDPIATIASGGTDASVALQVQASAASVANILVQGAAALQGANSTLTPGVAVGLMVQSLASTVGNAPPPIDLAQTAVLQDVLINAARNADASTQITTTETNLQNVVSDLTVVMAAAAAQIEQTLNSNSTDLLAALTNIAQIQIVAQGSAANAIQSGTANGNLSNAINNFTGEALDTATNQADPGIIIPTEAPPPPPPPPAATFTVTTTNDIISFGGTATGNISLVINAEGSATFTRQGVTATTISSIRTKVIDTPDGATSFTITGTAGNDTLRFKVDDANTGLTLTGDLKAGADRIMLVLPDDADNSQTLLFNSTATMTDADDELVIAFSAPLDEFTLTQGSVVNGYETLQQRGGELLNTARATLHPQPQIVFVGINDGGANL